VGGGGCERHDAHLRWLPRRRCPDTWLPRRTCPGYPDKRRDLLEESCGGHNYRPRIRRRQAVPYCHSVLGLCADPRSNGAVARGDFARALAFEVVLTLIVEVAHTIAFRLTLVTHAAAGGLRPVGLRAVRWRSQAEPDGRDSLPPLFTRMAQDQPTADRQQPAN